MLEFAWKDADVVLFMSTVHNGHEVIARNRRRPAATATGAVQTRKVFGREVIKLLEIPQFINSYNHFIKGVNQADQLRYYYST